MHPVVSSGDLGKKGGENPAENQGQSQTQVGQVLQCKVAWGADLCCFETSSSLNPRKIHTVA